MTTATGTATYAVLTEEQRVFYELNMLQRAIPNFLHLWFGMEGSVHPVTILPDNKGHQIQWNKLSAFTAVTTALTEGVTPDPQDITITSTTGTVAEYGAYIRYTRSLAQMGKKIAHIKSLLNNLGTLRWQPEASSESVQPQRLSEETLH